ncbi:hypothetical protein AB0L41_23975 [Amycolatopsis mediterranei]|uniref:hypothetical protein n=1 Tax=Amycolatopsis mediterranei TaxID=33910 RepID=UPI00342F8792
MKHVVVEAEDGGRFLDPSAYLELLPTFAENLPVGARAFATEDGHYDFFSQRCVKDLKPDTVLSGETYGERWLELRFRHNCWKHEEDLTIRYSGVSDVFPASSCRPPIWEEGNAVALDEILPHEHGCSHEIRFLSGSLTVLGQDLTASWAEADCPEKSDRSPQS